MASFSRDESRLTLTFLNETRSWTLPLDWHAEELAFGTRLWKLHLHYMEYLTELDDDIAVALIDDWIQNNPPYCREYWLDAWNSYAVSIRTVVWMQELSRRGGAFPAGVRKRTLESLWRQLRFLERNLELDVRGNHLVKNARALLWGARFLDAPEASGWGRRATELLRGILEEQILSDGMHYERSPSYHAQVFCDLLDIQSLVRAPGLARRLDEVLPAMAEALAVMVHPDRGPALFNDATLHGGPSPDTGLARWRNRSGQELSGPGGAFSLPEAGYFGWRDEETCFLVDCGPVAPDHLPAHAQADILSFEYSVGGKRIVVDPGVFEYNAGPRRHRSRATTSHNTLSLDGRDQCEFWGAFRMGRRASPQVLTYRVASDGFMLEGEHDGYTYLDGAPVHRRRFEFSQNDIRILDDVVGGDGQEAQVGLLLHPACEVKPGRSRVVVEREGVVVEIRGSGAVCSQPAVWCPDFGVELPTRRLEWTYGRAPVEGEVRLKHQS